MLRSPAHRQLATILLMTLAVVGGFALAGWTAHAATTSFSIESVGSQIGLGNADLKQTIINIIRWALGIVTLAAVAYMIYGGYLWLTAAGNEARVEKAKQVILQAAIGLVIILLAWAIVIFVVRNSAQVTSNVNGSEEPPTGCVFDCGLTPATFDIVAVNTCAAPPVWQDVPRTSAVSFTFNNTLRKIPSGQPSTTSYNETVDPINVAVEGSRHSLKLEECTDSTCATVQPAASQTPATLNGQVYTAGTTTLGNDANPLSEWLAIQNTLTFYHLSSNTPTDKNMFEVGKWYKATIPLKDPDGLRDIYSDEGRLLSFCRQNPASPTNDIDHCDFDAGSNNLIYTFQAGADIAGQPIKTTATTPSDQYRRIPGTPIDRNVPRSTSIGVFFDGGIDPISITTDNFELYELSSVPSQTDGLCGGAECGGTQVLKTDLIARPLGGNGATLAYGDSRWLKPFTWYKVVAKDFRNLCGTVMAPAQYHWVFETNDVIPGVEYVYPANGDAFSCPSTPVFAKFNTSMWNSAAGNTCSLGANSSFQTTAWLWRDSPSAQVSGSWSFEDQPPVGATDLNAYCRKLVFTPAAALVPGVQYDGLVIANRKIDQDGHTISYGDRPPVGVPALPVPPGGWDFPSTSPAPNAWHFKIAQPNACAQRPIVDFISPNTDSNGACISVLGRYFEKPSETISNGQPETGDALHLGNQEQLSSVTTPVGSDVKSWTNSTIVNKLDAGSLVGTYHYKVTVRYPTFGDLDSDASGPSSAFTLATGPASTRPCLYSLSPNSGYPGSMFTASGENLGSTPGTIVTDNASPWSQISPSTWTPTSITNIQVRNTATATPTQVQVLSSGGMSNAVRFDVLTPVVPTVGVPAVVEEGSCNPLAGVIPSPNPKNGDTAACRNTKIQVRFNMDIDPVSASLAVTLQAMPAGTPVAGTATAVGPIVTFTPTANLVKNQDFRVTISTTPPNEIKASVGGATMAAPYTWSFKTIDSDDLCVVDSVVIQPPGPVLMNNPNYFPYGIAASPLDAACHVLTTTDKPFDWTETKPTVGALDTPLTGRLSSGQTITRPAAGPAADTTDITVTTQGKISPVFKFTYDPIGCTTSAQCMTNALGESCSTSACVDGSCLPVLNTIDKNNGTDGNYVTFEGCWFDNYDPAVSKVTFSSGLQGVVPSAPGCTNYWTNERIIREVPSGTETGPVSVTRRDLQVAPAPADPIVTFTKNSTAYPKLCNISPAAGPRGGTASVTLLGTGFGAPKDAADNVTFAQVPPGTTTAVATDYPQWTNASIQAGVPASTAIGGNNVFVTRGAQTSNRISYLVQSELPDPCLGSKRCTFGFDGDTECQTGAGYDASYACSYPVAGGGGRSCCVKRPVITTFSPAPGATNICRNIIPTVTFNQPLDPSTVTPITIRYLNEATVMSPTLSVQNTASTGTISMYPGYLSSGALQTVNLTAESVLYSLDVKNPSFETDVVRAPDNWNVAVTSRVSRSTDVPPGHTGYSMVADCTACSPGQMEYAAQNIGGTWTVTGAQFRVSGWVKAEVQSSSAGAGFITECDLGDNCGFLVPGQDPGEYPAPGGGWKRWEVVVTKDSTSGSKLQLKCFATPGAKVWCDDVQVLRIDNNVTTIRGANGTLAQVTGMSAPYFNSPLTFTTGPGICRIASVSVTPSQDRFTFNGEKHAGPDAWGVPQPGFFAQPYSDAGQSISPIPGVYNFTANWQSSVPTVATVTDCTPGTYCQNADVTASSSGTTMISAKLKVTTDTVGSTVGTEYIGQSRVDVDICGTPWSFTDTASNCDTGGACNDYHFQLFYCRDRASGLLPSFTYNAGPAGPIGAIEGVNGADANRLKSYFFKENAASRDTIGLLIYKNPNNLSPYDWFHQRFPLDTGGSSTVVGGYPAVKTGTTTYIGVTHFNGTALEGLMFIFDYNSNNAAADTVTIAGQMLEHAYFNQNLTWAQKAELILDTKRLQDLASLKVMLQAYKTTNGAYPTLPGGTYLPSMSVSTWPSWQETLGAALGKTLPVDPVNKLSSAASYCSTANGYEAATCWKESVKNFSCPAAASSFSYAYRYITGPTPKIQLFTRLTYAGPGSLIGSAQNACSGTINTAPSACDCYNYKLEF